MYIYLLIQGKFPSSLVSISFVGMLKHLLVRRVAIRNITDKQLKIPAFLVFKVGLNHLSFYNPNISNSQNFIPQKFYYLNSILSSCCQGNI